MGRAFFFEAGRCAAGQGFTKVSLAHAAKMNEKFAVRAFAGPETGMDLTGL